MNYELAKELKDAGWGEFQGTPDEFLLDNLPDLEELIYQCGDQLLSLLNGRAITRLARDKWIARGGLPQKRSFIPRHETVGDTPDEAVARLWLALQTTKRQK